MCAEHIIDLWIHLSHIVDRVCLNCPLLRTNIQTGTPEDSVPPFWFDAISCRGVFWFANVCCSMLKEAFVKIDVNKKKINKNKQTMRRCSRQKFSEPARKMQTMFFYNRTQPSYNILRQLHPNGGMMNILLHGSMPRLHNLLLPPSLLFIYLWCCKKIDTTLASMCARHERNQPRRT